LVLQIKIIKNLESSTKVFILVTKVYFFKLAKKFIMTLGTKLNNLRQLRGISLEKLAFELDLSKTAIGKWEADKSKPSIDNLSKLCDYYEVDVYELLDDVSNINFSNAKFKGSSYAAFAQNFTVNYANSPELLDNQKQITALIEKQNELILKLLEGK
jgi:transcriptional regulator with XRE-family HTH domain